MVKEVEKDRTGKKFWEIKKKKYSGVDKEVKIDE